MDGTITINMILDILKNMILDHTATHNIYITLLLHINLKALSGIWIGSRKNYNEGSF